MNKDELLLAWIRCAHDPKCRAKLGAAFLADCPLTAEHKQALTEMKVPMKPGTKHDRGRKKTRCMDGSEADYFRRACGEVRETAKRLGCTQKVSLEILTGPRSGDYPMWDDATCAKVRAEELGVWRQRAATLSTIHGKDYGDRYDWSRFADRIAAELHLD